MFGLVILTQFLSKILQTRHHF